MADQHVLIIEKADPRMPGALGQPEQVLGVIVAIDPGPSRPAATGPAPRRRAPRIPARHRPRRPPGGGGRPPFGRQADLAAGARRGRRAAASHRPRAAAAPQIGEQVDRGLIEPRLATRLHLADRAKSASPKSSRAGRRPAAEDRRRARGAQPGFAPNQAVTANGRVSARSRAARPFRQRCCPPSRARSAGRASPLSRRGAARQPAPARKAKRWSRHGSCGRGSARSGRAPSPDLARSDRRGGRRRRRKEVGREHQMTRQRQQGPEPVGPFDEADRRAEGLVEPELGETRRRLPSR